MHNFFRLPSWACPSLVASLLAAGCTSPQDIEPAQPCATTATVRLCHGRTTMCATEHTTLELTNGTQVRPTGELWEAYLPKQKDGQVLRVSYAPVVRITNDAPAIAYVTLSCLEEQLLRCGNE